MAIFCARQPSAPSRNVRGGVRERKKSRAALEGAIIWHVAINYNLKPYRWEALGENAPALAVQAKPDARARYGDNCAYRAFLPREAAIAGSSTAYGNSARRAFVE